MPLVGDVQATNGLRASMCVLGQCGGIQRPNDPKDHPLSHFNIILMLYEV